MKELIKHNFFRLLGLMNRNESSKTKGCFDRYFWKYKFTDYPNLRLQEGIYSLCFLYNFKLFNKGVKANVLRKYIKWSLEFYFRNLNYDGSAMEAFPFERSFCATAFTSYILTEMFSKKNFLPINGKKEYIKKLKSTIFWLTKFDNYDVSNQQAAKIASLYNYFLLTGETIYKEIAEKELNKLLYLYSQRGCFFEYSGFDIGYESLTLSILTNIYNKNRSRKLENVINDSLTHIDKYIDQKGLFDYKKNSRNTQFIYPFAAFYFKHNLKSKILKGFENYTILTPSDLDDRYFIPFLNEYLNIYKVFI